MLGGLSGEVVPGWSPLLVPTVGTDIYGQPGGHSGGPTEPPQCFWGWGGRCWAGAPVPTSPRLRLLLHPMDAPLSPSLVLAAGGDTARPRCPPRAGVCSRAGRLSLPTDTPNPRARRCRDGRLQPSTARSRFGGTGEAERRRRRRERGRLASQHLPHAAPPCRQDPLGLTLDFPHPKAVTLPKSPPPRPAHASPCEPPARGPAFVSIPMSHGSAPADIQSLSFPQIPLRFCGKQP